MVSHINEVDVIHAFAHLFRLPVGILAGMAGCVAVYVLTPTLPLQHYLLTAVTLALMYSAACAINDYWDVDKDRIDHPDRPLPSYQLSLQQAWWAAVMLFAFALIAAVPLGIYPFLLVLVSVILLWNYSLILLHNGIIGNFVVATIVAALILFSSLVAAKPLAMAYPAWFLFCYTLAKELIWDIHDAAGDRSQGIITIANRWGDRAAFTLAWGLIGLLIGSILFALHWLPMAHPVLFVGFASAMVIALGIALVHYQEHRNDTAYRQLIFWERLSMVFGVLGLLGTAPATY